MKKNKTIINQLIGLLIFISSPVVLSANHIIGGKITYRYLGSNNYEIKLTVYRDCSTDLEFDNPAPLAVYDNSTYTLVYNHQITLSHSDTINPNNPNPCFILPPGICVEEGYNLDTVNLPPNTSGYTVTYQRCCHNQSIANIIAPAFNGITITANIPPQINNTATFLNYPPIYICLNDTFNYSFAATDADNDSLVYQLCEPYLGGTDDDPLPNPALPPPYKTTHWANGFSANNPITTSNGINFNANTGMINFIPSQIGQYAIALCVLEYRGGILLNINRLEIEFNVVPCSVVSSIPIASNLCDGLEIEFQNSSANAIAYHWDFGVSSVSSDTSNIASPTFAFPTYGTYPVSLVAMNSNYGSCKDTTIKVIKINPLLAPTLAPNFSACYNNNEVALNIGGAYDNSATFNWNLGNHATPNNPSISNPSIHFDTIAQNISAIVSQFGCSDTLHSRIDFIKPIAEINQKSLNCSGSNLTFNSFSNVSKVFWDFGVSSLTTDTSSLIKTTFNYPSYGNYVVTLVAFDGICSDTLKLPITVNDSVYLNPIDDIEKQCLKGNSFDFFANGKYSSNASFIWGIDLTGNPLISNQENPVNISFSTVGNHVVKLYMEDNGCSTQRIHIVKTVANPKANFTVSDSIICQESKIDFINQSTSSNPFTSIWNIEEKERNEFNPNNTFNNSGLYSIYLAVTDTNNCSDTLEKINYIEVLPSSKAIVNATPLKTDILNPKITFTDNTIGTHTTNFIFGDNETSNQIFNHHTYSDTGTYAYQLLVTNNLGCSDTARGSVIIEPLKNSFIPNSFTPNNDGLNDVFKPIVPYYKFASLQIFDRWGNLTYHANTIEQGWDGKYQGENVVSDVYVYKLEIEFLDGSTQKKYGHITLMR